MEPCAAGLRRKASQRHRATTANRDLGKRGTSTDPPSGAWCSGSVGTSRKARRFEGASDVGWAPTGHAGLRRTPGAAPSFIQGMRAQLSEVGLGGGGDAHHRLTEGGGPIDAVGVETDATRVANILASASSRSMGREDDEEGEGPEPFSPNPQAVLQMQRHLEPGRGNEALPCVLSFRNRKVQPALSTGRDCVSPQRFTALATSGADGGWSAARQHELIPDEAVSLASPGKRRAIITRILSDSGRDRSSFVYSKSAAPPNCDRTSEGGPERRWQGRNSKGRSSES